MLIKFAFRNVMRNKKRTTLTALSIFVASFVVVLAHGFINGIIDGYFYNYVKYQTGNMRVTTFDFIKREKFLPVDELLDNPQALKERILQITGVSTVEERIKFGIILGKGEKSVYSIGIGLETDKSVLGLKNKLVSGEIGGHGIYIGKGLAEKLGIKLGDSLLIAGKTSEGGLNGIKLQVKGIFRFNMSFDKNFFIIDINDARKLLKAGTGTTELLVYTKDFKNNYPVKEEIAKLLSQDESVQDIKDQLRDLYSMFSIAKYIYYIMEGLIVLLASFVIVNTIMMAVFERVREIGTLKALGMRDRELFANFTYEGAIIGAFGGISGALSGYLFLYSLKDTGINLEFAFSDINMPVEYILRPSVTLDVLVFTIIIAVLISAIAAMIPSRYAWRLLPADALRKS